MDGLKTEHEQLMKMIDSKFINKDYENKIHSF